MLVPNRADEQPDFNKGFSYNDPTGTPRHGADRQKLAGSVVGIVYLAAPYSHDDPAVKQQRFDLINQVAAHFMNDGLTIFSPISMSHPIAKYGLPTDWDFWCNCDTKFIKASCELMVLQLPGWQESTGVTAEIEIANALDIPVTYIDPIDILGEDYETDRQQETVAEFAAGWFVRDRQRAADDNQPESLSLGVDGELMAILEDLAINAHYSGIHSERGLDAGVKSNKDRVMIATRKVINEVNRLSQKCGES